MNSEIIKPIVRSLVIIRAMNQRRLSTVSELHRITGIPKSTVHRLLHTLMYCGYVEKDIERSVYILTDQVLTLSEGFGQESKMVQASIPIAKQLTQEIKWPIAIGTFDYNAIVVQYSTRPFSQLTLRPSTVNKRFPLFKSAMGQAYFSFCTEQARNKVINILRNDELEEDPIIQCDQSINQFIAEVQKRGYGLRKGLRGESTHIAVPIIHDTEVIGIIGVSIFSSCFNKEVADTYPDLLRQSATKILNDMTQNSAFTH